jgi:hypothetical protein
MDSTCVVKGAWWIGLGIAVVGGWLVCAGLFWIVNKVSGLPAGKPKPHVPAWLSGVVERGVFACAIAAVGLDGSLIAAMGGWMALKLATNWNRDPWTDEEKSDKLRKERGFRALLVGLVSLAMAAFGGAIMYSSCDLFPNGFTR